MLVLNCSTPTLGLVAHLLKLDNLEIVNVPQRLTLSALGFLDFAAVALWLAGFGFEAVADAQLARFRSNPRSRGEVLDRGIWRYTRHPNYFGECLIWWGFYLLALAGGGWWSFPAPLLMTVLLLRVSGVALLERDISDRRPAYRDYMRSTNAFVPGPRKASPVASGRGGHA